MSLLPQIPSIPTVHNGVEVDPVQLAAAITYLAAIHRKGKANVTWVSPKKPLAAYKGDDVASHGAAEVLRGFEHDDFRDDDGVSGAMKWGEWLLYPWIKIHNGNLYARLYPVMGTVEMTYTHNGEVVSHTQYKTLVPKRKPSANSIATIDVRIDRLTVL